ncbi:MAG: creatininase family protein [Armatimonadota bacterium]|nr:creatininase family protein [Armatimonadota bacterium]MDR7423525.1 creatininase family protein [Armatimonadota bacterium]MDR7454263.1 creatininase family protein [Armatimonadota bacterium]MDR7456787.1 creatininase family protein [Armatimonadota bacterium]MDR7497341.1 creatininase family protein [Armatimonadota bacterium]
MTCGEPGPPGALPPDEVLIERMTWEQVRDAIARGATRVLLVAGAMEQHGPHMAIATDTLLGYAIATRLARRLGRTLVAPAITVGVSAGQLSHAGTLSLSPETFGRVLVDYCESLAVHGFTEIMLIASHGGNIRPIGENLPELRRRLPGVRILASETDPSVVAGKLERVCRKHGLNPALIGFHAGQGETSMMLATHPDLVDMCKAVEGFTGDVSIRWRAATPPPMSTMSPTGILGDARGSTVEIGELLLEERVAELEALVRAGTPET